MIFDIQKFADEEIQEYGDILDGAVETSEETLEPIPKELEGIPEDIARDIMRQAAEKNSSEETSEPTPAQIAPANVAEPTDETSVPYQRFKEAVDQKNELAQQIAAYRERYGDLSAQTPQQPTQAPQEMPVQNQPQINEAAIKQIDDAIMARAMAISGLSKEDVDSVDYFDDDDPRINIWNHAKELAKATVYQDIISTRIAQQQEMQRLQMLQNQSVANYNEYVKQKQATENFDAVRQYATGEFFNAQPPIDKEIITESFARLRQNMASPADMMIVRDFFTRAENSFVNKNGQAATPKKAPTPTKPNFPRTNQLNGIAGNGGGVTQAQLDEMLRNRKWSEIPPHYQKMLLGM